MKRILLFCIVAVVLGSFAAGEDPPMRLGNFSISLAVKDIRASRAFYEELGFHVAFGDESKNWIILQNDTATIGVYHNPGWDRSGNALPVFDDVREIQQALKAQGIALAMAADEASASPASLMVIDPDGNPILLDQHTAKP